MPLRFLLSLGFYVAFFVPLMAALGLKAMNNEKSKSRLLYDASNTGAILVLSGKNLKIDMNKSKLPDVEGSIFDENKYLYNTKGKLDKSSLHLEHHILHLEKIYSGLENEIKQLSELGIICQLHFLVSIQTKQGAH